MTDHLFIVNLTGHQAGEVVSLRGDEGRHAIVKRIAVDETVLLADGDGLTCTGVVTDVLRDGIDVCIGQVVAESAPARPITVVQALIKGDRSELAVEMMTELGVDRILAWQSQRAIVKWSAERRDKGLDKWRKAAVRATKQSRRSRCPKLDIASTSDIVSAIPSWQAALVLHEDATESIAAVDLSEEGPIGLIVGPEGGITPDELERFVAAGARPVRISDGVLRASTAGAVAAAQLWALQSALYRTT